MRPGAIQIAGVVDAEDASVVVACGIDYLGFPLGLEVLRGDCTEDEARRIVRTLPESVEPVLITYLVEPREIAALARSIGASWVQLHGTISVESTARLRTLAPELRLARSLVVRGQGAELEGEIDAFAPYVSAYLTDTFDERTGARGATGRTHDWAVSRRLAAYARHPLVLAGGLDPENVGEAITAVAPAAVDVHTGVEAPDGRKCRERLQRFVAEARRAFRASDAASQRGRRR